MSKNITLAVDESVLNEDQLEGIAKQEDRTVRARRRLLELIDASTLEVGDFTWTRDQLHDR